MRQALKEDILALARQVSQRHAEATVVSDTHVTPANDSGDTHVTAAVLVKGIRSAELQAEAGDDWEWLQADPRALEAFAASVNTSRMLRAGKVPDDYTSKTSCKQCGEVPIFAGCPPEVLGCPWCFVGGFANCS